MQLERSRFESGRYFRWVANVSPFAKCLIRARARRIVFCPENDGPFM
jgi:hypothetical protein